VATNWTVSPAACRSSKDWTSPPAWTSTTSGGAAIRPTQENSLRSKRTPSAPAICELSTPGMFMIWIRSPSGFAAAVRPVASRLPAPGSFRTTISAPRHSPMYGAIVRA
jgi:hypothetical protein